VYDHNSGQIAFEGMGPRLRRMEDAVPALAEGGDDD